MSDLLESLSDEDKKVATITEEEVIDYLCNNEHWLDEDGSLDDETFLNAVKEIAKLVKNDEGLNEFVENAVVDGLRGDALNDCVAREITDTAIMYALEW